MGAALRLIARHGKLALVAGLLAGLTLPDLAWALRPHIPFLIVCLLGVTAARIGWRAALGSLGDLRTTLTLVAVYQVALPILVVVPAVALGLTGLPLVLAVILMLAAPSVTGAPNFAILMGHDPAPALRLLIVGTAVFPLTVLPFLWFMPEFSDPFRLLAAGGRFFLLIAAGVSFGFVFREAIGEPGREDMKTLDGVAAVLLAVVVVGLMSAIGPALREAPGSLLFWAVAVFAVNFGLQIAAALVMGRHPATPARSIAAGNRNIALMLLVLPPETTTPLMIFIGCYQLPMYLTPILLARFYARVA